MPDMVILILIFVGTGIGFLAMNMMVGKLVRPARPNAEKSTIYECGEPTIGSSWIQFDVRFYVVALLFVIFDVEVAFFFPWATVFGNANKLADPNLSAEQRIAAQHAILPDQPTHGHEDGQAGAARRFAWLAFADLLVFFGVLLVGFAYLWKRGDLDWVRSTAAQPENPPLASTRMEL